METQNLKDAVKEFKARLENEKESGIHVTKPVLFDLLVETTKSLHKLDEYLNIVEAERLKTQLRGFCVSQFTEFKLKYQDLFQELPPFSTSTAAVTVNSELISNAKVDVEFLMTLFNRWESKYGNEWPICREYPNISDVRAISDKILNTICRSSNIPNATPMHDLDLSEIEVNIEALEDSDNMMKYSIIVPNTYSNAQLKTIVDTLIPTDI